MWGGGTISVCVKRRVCSETAAETHIHIYIIGKGNIHSAG